MAVIFSPFLLIFCKLGKVINKNCAFWGLDIRSSKPPLLFLPYLKIKKKNRKKEMVDPFEKVGFKKNKFKNLE